MPSAWTKPGRFSGNRNQEPKLTDLLPLKKFKPGVFYELRAIGAPFTYAEHWFEVYKKDSTDSYRKRKLCIGYNDETGEFSGKCPYCEILGSQARIATLQNFIDRKLERSMPRDLPTPLKSESKLKSIVNDAKGEWYLKEKDSESWTPVEPVRLPSSPCQDIGNMVGSNTRPNKDGEQVPMPPEHVKYGFDIKLKYDDKASPAKQYFVEKAGPSKLGEDEMDYLIYKLDVEAPEAYAEAKKHAEYFLDKLVEQPGGQEEKPAAGGRGKEGKSAGRGALADLDDDEKGFDPEDVDEQEEKPARRKPAARREDPEDQEDEPEEKPARRKPVARRDDDQEDEPEEKPARKPATRRADPDEEDEPAPRRKPTRRDDDDEEPEEKPRRSSASSKPKPSARRANQIDDDDDNDGDLDL